ncbi:uncharacterized protein Dwil_GK19687 [Drosophila willistoni]|uniref:NSFL1 cofactor p47 n=1 Tax=Drosophila willistoni TaxID=7260 RepID=B4MP31_DROWI|nr:NSFL1 cofactor p47 [Drosophila willistoni]EDW73870.1 uncharacterized protein Dwil_GK19687 [Drosophila willistoni]
MSNEQKVDTFMKKHGVREDIARQYLTANGWVLDQASFRYESDKDGRNNNPTKEDTASLPDPQSLHSLISQHTNRNATDKDEGYFAGASESSGQQIGGPKRVSIENSTPALTTNDSDRSIRAWGTGIRLGSAHPINPPPARSDSEDSELQTETEHTIVVLHLWSEGFSLDDGSLRPYEVPENERFLRAVLRGDYPHEMQEFGHRVELSVQDHTNESFRHLSRKQFMGSGRLLGSPSPRVESATTPQSIPTANLTPEQRAESGLHFNEKLPMTVIQLRLADGSRVAARFNLTHIIADIYRYIRLARPHYSSQRFILITAFPRQQLDESDPRTLGQADLRNVLVIQHLCEDPDDEQTQSDGEPV